MTKRALSLLEATKLSSTSDGYYISIDDGNVELFRAAETEDETRNGSRVNQHGQHPINLQFLRTGRHGTIISHEYIYIYI